VRLFFTITDAFGAWRRRRESFEERVKDVDWAREADEKFRAIKKKEEERGSHGELLSL